MERSTFREQREPLGALVKAMRAEGIPFRRIAEQLNIPLSTIHRWSRSGDAPVVAASTVGDAPIVLDTPADVLREIDAVYACVATDGYSAASALRERLLRHKAELLWKMPVPPCERHWTMSSVYEMWGKFRDATIGTIRRRADRGTEEERELFDELYRDLRNQLEGVCQQYIQAGWWPYEDEVTNAG